MDTLPQVLTFEQLKPGDLIFYEGTFTSKRSKVQKHNNVHVEIFLGGETGEATIGARFQKGVVSVFPSYKFESKSWTLIRHHFRSIDTWLDGQCVSHCTEHPWISESGSLYAAAGRRSIFNDEEDGEEAAGDYDDDDDGSLPDPGDSAGSESGGGDGEGSIASEVGDGGAVLSSVFDIAAAEGDVGTDSPVAVAEAMAPGSKKTISARPKRTNTSPSKAASASNKIPPRRRPAVTNSSEDLLAEPAPLSKRAQTRAAEKEKREMMEGRPLPKTYYVHKSNGWKLVCAALDRRGWQQLPFEYNMSTRFTLKWVERRSQIDYKAHVAGQLVNHIINNDVFTTKLGLVNTLRDYFCRTFTLGSSNSGSVSPVKGASTSSGKKQPAATSARISFDDMISSTTPRLPTPWLMETYQLDQAIDCAAVLKEDEEATANDTAGSIHLWIYKPSCGNRGRGVHVVRGGRELQELVGSYVNHYHPTLVSTDTFKGNECCYYIFLLRK